MARWPDDQMTRFLLADFFTPVFESLLYDGHELVSDGAVDNAMVIAQREVNDGADGDGICAVFVGDHHGLFGDTADAHDGNVRLVDDGQAEDGAKLAGVGDGEGCTFDVSRHELLRTGALAEVGDAALQSEEVELVGVLENGDDESPIERDGDAGVDVLVVTDAIAFERTVDDGILLQGDDGGAHKERHEGKPRAIALLEAVLELVSQIDDASHVHLEHAVDVSAGAARFDHALRDDLAHLGHGYKVARNHSRRRGRGLTGYGGRSWSSRAVLDEIEDVLLGDAAASAGAAYLCKVHIVLAGELADKRGRANVGIFFVLRSAGGGRGRRSGRSRSNGLGRGGGGSATAVANHTDDGVDLNGVAFGNLDFLKDSAGWGGDFGVDLVGGNL